MKIFFAARARAKKFFFFLTRFVERTGDALGLVCLGNAATPDRLRIRSLRCGRTGMPLAAKATRATFSNGLRAAGLALDFEVQTPPHDLIMVWTKVSFFECSDLQADLAHGDAAILER